MELTHITCFLHCPCYNCNVAEHSASYDSKAHKVIECWKCNSCRHAGDGFRWADHPCEHKNRPCEPDMERIN